ncbi:MAG: M48 family metalloprotease [Methyloligellaceae bacterium]
MLARKGGALILALIIAFTSHPALAAGTIRDAEIENLIRDYATPIFRVAGLGSQNITIHLVADRSFNAFVIDGQNMFFHVGTLMRSETPNQVIGVIAHETGHIAGGHLSRLRQAIAQARSTSLITRLIGIAIMGAGVAAGGGGSVGSAGAAVMLGGQSMVQRSVLAYRRTEESAADQAALAYLNATQQSAKGMLQTFAFFANQGLASLRHVDPYLLSHPMPQQRIVQLRTMAKQSIYYNKKDPPELQKRHDMMRAKLSGFLDNPQTVFNRYPKSDQTLPARYARTIALYRRSGLRPFLPEIDALIAEEPRNPYFYELKGQFLFKSGKAAEAIGPLRQAVSLAPREGLIRILLAQALLAADEKAYVDEAIRNLRLALVKEKYSAIGYRQLASAYARKGQVSLAELASAHAYLFEGRLKLAKQQAERAKAKLKRGSPNWIKADDIVNYQPPKL